MDNRVSSIARPRTLQFRLSTILILIAIAAGALACRPWVRVGVGDINNLRSIGWTDTSSAGAFQVAILSIRHPGPSSATSGLVVEFGPNPQLLWPAVALAIFLIGKAGWLLAERRTTHREAIPQS